MKMNLFSKLSATAAALTVAIALTSVLPSAAAFAEDPVILVVSRTQVFRASLAGQEMRTRLEAIQTEIGADQNKDMEDLTEVAKKLMQDKASFPPEQLKQKQMEVGQREEFIRYKYEQELQATQETAQNKVLAALYPILQAIMEEKAGTILLDQSNLLMASADYNITAEAIKRLDVSTPTISIERILYDDMVKAMQAQQEKAKEAAVAAK